MSYLKFWILFSIKGAEPGFLNLGGGMCSPFFFHQDRRNAKFISHSEGTLPLRFISTGNLQGFEPWHTGTNTTGIFPLRDVSINYILALTGLSKECTIPAFMRGSYFLRGVVTEALPNCLIVSLISKSDGTLSGPLSCELTLCSDASYE